MTWRTWAWVGGATWVASFTVLVSYLVSVGLDRADKVASVVALCVGVLGLSLQVVSNVNTRRTADHSVSQTVIGGSMVVVRRVRRGSWVRLRRPGRLPPGFGLPSPPSHSPGTPSGQQGPQTYVRGNSVEIEDVGQSVVEEQ